MEDFMLRGMVFIDHMNFEIAVNDLYRRQGLFGPKLDYSVLPQQVAKLMPCVELVKTFLFVPKPDDFLMRSPSLKQTYEWAVSLKNMPFFDVIEGSYLSRPMDGRVKDLADKTSYYKVEKGTDINMAAHALSKAYYNAYDVAFFLSADSDYISIYSILKNIGKLSVVVAVEGQFIDRIKPHVDSFYHIDQNFLELCRRQIPIKP